MISHRKTWLRIAKLGDLPADIAPDVLRHSFAVLPPIWATTRPTIAFLLSHNTHSITRRYVHFVDAVLLGAADPVANAPMKLMAEKPNLTPNQAQPQLGHQPRDAAVMWDGITSL